MAERGWSASVTVANDTFALLRAGTEDGVGVAPDGRTARFPAIGRISGDWGGGAFLGHEVLWWAVRRGRARAEVRLVEAAPVLGAGLLGLDHLGAGPPARRRLRGADPRPDARHG
ncbi:hypothetical protein GCM10011581_18190 [Saccharopolyspora subtropica]|uniref:Uncharacterized protein n=1 Tax=Saccharopolyspora thermophila TaxID=89367 RepID=A0A917N9S5_9PSEU|nr:hypothetical protein GCM10011581_18190 [Saccharopolyspora subtropica]